MECEENAKDSSASTCQTLPQEYGEGSILHTHEEITISECDNSDVGDSDIITVKEPTLILSQDEVLISDCENSRDNDIIIGKRRQIEIIISEDENSNNTENNDMDIAIVEEPDETISQNEKNVSAFEENTMDDVTIIEVHENVTPELSSASNSEELSALANIETVNASVEENKRENAMCEDFDVIYDSNCENSTPEVELDFSKVPVQITGAWKEFKSTSRHNFTRGCKWAPDGSCILTCSDDNVLRIFNLPQQLWDFSQWSDMSEIEAVVKISEGELIYDYCWYPLMNSCDPATCCLASSSRKSTVHLWDGFTGELRCSYRTFNQMDELVTPHSLSFDSDGQRLFCGFDKAIRIFNVDTPGRDFEERPVYSKKIGQPGIISCFAFTSVDKNISAAGSYQKTVGIYSEPNGELLYLLEGQKGGLTQLQFSPDGNYLYSGGRKDPEILCWDLRKLPTVLFSLRRSCVTNQRMYFDISRCGRYIVSGNQNGVITAWDVTKEPRIISEDEFPVIEPVQFFLAHDDCVNGVNLHPNFPLLCSSSGQRKFPTLLEDDEDEKMFSSKIEKWDNSVRLWWIVHL